MRSFIWILTLTFTFSAFSTSYGRFFTKAPPLFSKVKSKVVLEGYDVVAYFEPEDTEDPNVDPRVVKGNAEFEYIYEDYVWRFSSAKNLEAFKVQSGKIYPSIRRFLCLRYGNFRRQIQSGARVLLSYRR